MNSSFAKRNATGLLLACLMLMCVGGGCYQDPIRARLIGTWHIDQGQKLTRRINQVDTSPDEEQPDPASRMVLAFFSSGSLRTTTRIGQLNREKNGSWRVVSFDEQDAALKVSCELMGQQTEHEIQFIEKDLIRLVPPNMAGTRSKLTFRRK